MVTIGSDAGNDLHIAAVKCKCRIYYRRFIKLISLTNPPYWNTSLTFLSDHIPEWIRKGYLIHKGYCAIVIKFRK